MGETGEGRQEKASGDNQEMENDDELGMENDDNREMESGGNWIGDRKETESGDDTREMENGGRQTGNSDRPEESDGRRATASVVWREKHPAAAERASPAWPRGAATSAAAAPPSCLRG